MDNKKFFTLLSFIAVLLIIPIATAAVQSGSFNLRISALESEEPYNVKITDVSVDSFRVSWVTERQVIGGVFMPNGITFSEDDKTSYHSVRINTLDSATKYNFKLLSDSKEFVKPNGDDYSVKTAGSVGTSDSFLVYGQVFSPDGYSYQQGGVITIQLSNPLAKSQVFSTVLNKTGGFQFDLGGMMTQDLNKAFPYEARCDAEVEIFTDAFEEDFSKRYTIDFSTNNQLPNIYLGDVNIELLPAVDGS